MARRRFKIEKGKIVQVPKRCVIFKEKCEDIMEGLSLEMEIQVLLPYEKALGESIELFRMKASVIFPTEIYSRSGSETVEREYWRIRDIVEWLEPSIVLACNFSNYIAPQGRSLSVNLIRKLSEYYDRMANLIRLESSSLFSMSEQKALEKIRKKLKATRK